MTRKTDAGGASNPSGRPRKAPPVRAEPAPAEPAPAEPARAEPRRAGRRPKSADGSPELSRAALIDCAVRITQEESIAELTMVRLARELGVAPGLVHYYIGSRDALISAIVNLAYRERIEALPPLTGDWRHDVREVALVSRRTMHKWRGVSAYVASHNRSRLFQMASGDETDWGLAFFDRVGLVLKQGGFTPEQAAMAYHLLMLFLVSVSSAEANRQMPAVHREFILGYVGRAQAADKQGARFLVDPFTRIDVDATLETGLTLLLDGFDRWLASPGTGYAGPNSSRR